MSDYMEHPSGAEKTRLHKFLAHAGYGSRRACEELIVAGRVRVDGEIVTTLGVVIDPSAQEIRVDEERVKTGKKVYFLLYKPRGFVCTNAEDEKRPRVVDLFRGVSQRIYTVGRLDADSEGLIIVTNDGAFANKLTHPRYGVPKIYHVRVRGFVSDDRVKALLEGVWLSSGKARASAVRIIHRERASTVLELRLQEGKNREVRRMLARLGFNVRRLIRVAIGSLKDRALAPGRYRRLTQQEIDLLTREADEYRKSHRRHPRRSKGKQTRSRA